MKLTARGEDLLLELIDCYDPDADSVFTGASPLKDLYGKLPEAMEMMAIVRQIYGDDFMEIFEKSFNNLESDFLEEGRRLEKAEINSAV